MTELAKNGALRQRAPRVRDKAHLAWVAKLSCLRCFCNGRNTWPVHVCHIRIKFTAEEGWREIGKAEKPDDHHVWPGCAACHLDGPEAQHSMSERAFWRRTGVYPPAFCAALVVARESGARGMDVIRKAASGAFPWPDDA